MRPDPMPLARCIVALLALPALCLALAPAPGHAAIALIAYADDPSPSPTPNPTPPPAPTVLGTIPGSPATNTRPDVYGSATADTTVGIFTDAACSGNPLATGTAARFVKGIEVVVDPNSTTTFYAATLENDGDDDDRACSTTFAVYTVDSTAPAPPAFSDSDPDSPANHNLPRVKGTAETQAIVRLYADPACAGALVAQGSGAAFASPGLELAVRDDVSTTLFGTATDPLGNASACSAASITYAEDSTPPETTIVSGPSGTIAFETAVLFGFSSSEGESSFECSADSGAFEPCPPPRTVAPPPSPGAHHFAVRAIDRAGNTDPTPAARAYAVGAVALSPSSSSPPRDCTVRGRRNVGTAAGDTLTGTAASDHLLGGAGSDLLIGLGGSDCLYGETGADRLRGGAGADGLFGGPGPDLLDGERGNDRLVGGAGHDRLVDRVGRDVFSGGAGNDAIDARDRSLRGRRTSDTVRCGDGIRDFAIADRRDRVSDDCERVRRL